MIKQWRLKLLIVHKHRETIMGIQMLISSTFSVLTIKIGLTPNRACKQHKKWTPRLFKNKVIDIMMV